MNRLSRYGLYLTASLVMSALIVGGQHLIMMPTVYNSIHQTGIRIGKVLPHGYSSQSRRVSAEPSLSVTLHQPTTIPVVPRGKHPDELTSREMLLVGQQAGIDLRVPMAVVVMYLAVLFLVSTISLWRHTQADFRNVPMRSFAGILALGVGVCVVIATMYSVARVFWTGVDSEFFNRSIIQTAGNSSIHVKGNQLLAMSGSELIMILIAMIMTAVPILYWIDIKLFRRVRWDNDQSDYRSSSMLSKVYENKLIERHFSEQSIKHICVFCYILTTVFLWTSPWSTTMAGALWVSL
jgi:hypothetical protein